jgi:Lon protease-like protein
LYALTVSTIGLFPLGIVLLPGERVPLHIFEPRYKELINECLTLGTTFGIVLTDKLGSRDVGTKAAVVELIERLPDGRLNILVEGRERFRLLELTEGRSFLTANTVEIVDWQDAPQPEIVTACLEAYRRFAAEAGIAVEEPVAEDGKLSFEIAHHLDINVGPKQELLEMISENDRLVRLRELLEEAMVALRRRAIEKLASLNGQVRRPRARGEDG